jgi:uncharacterized phage protein (TIGR01671 family)
MESELYLDQDGYPTDLALTLIEEANPFEKNPHDLMDFVKDLWQYTDWGWSEKKRKMYNGKKAILYCISTGGWSGNESIISALKNNGNFFWTLYWQSSRVGGHYKFLIPKKFEKDKEYTKEVTPQTKEETKAYATCGNCGKEMSHNVPRLGDSGGFVHKETGKFECKISKPTVKPSKLNFRSWDHQSKVFNFFDIRNSMGHLPTDIPNNQINQSTGLLDKTGKEIFEGDILCQYPDYIGSQNNKIKPAINKVYFENGCFFFDKIALNEFVEGEIPTKPLNLEGIEIIGNIFENPELVTKTEI